VDRLASQTSFRNFSRHSFRTLIIPAVMHLLLGAFFVVSVVGCFDSQPLSSEDFLGEYRREAALMVSGRVQELDTDLNEHKFGLGTTTWTYKDLFHTIFGATATTCFSAQSPPSCARDDPLWVIFGAQLPEALHVCCNTRSRCYSTCNNKNTCDTQYAECVHAFNVSKFCQEAKVLPTQTGHDCYQYMKASILETERLQRYEAYQARSRSHYENSAKSLVSHLLFDLTVIRSPLPNG
jgi:hypothetical protein